MLCALSHIQQSLNHRCGGVDDIVNGVLASRDLFLSNTKTNLICEWPGACCTFLEHLK